MAPSRFYSFKFLKAISAPNVLAVTRRTNLKLSAFIKDLFLSTNAVFIPLVCNVNFSNSVSSVMCGYTFGSSVGVTTTFKTAYIASAFGALKNFSCVSTWFRCSAWGAFFIDIIIVCVSNGCSQWRKKFICCRFKLTRIYWKFYIWQVKTRKYSNLQVNVAEIILAYNSNNVCNIFIKTNVTFHKYVLFVSKG